MKTFFPALCVVVASLAACSPRDVIATVPDGGGPDISWPDATDAADTMVAADTVIVPDVASSPDVGAGGDGAGPPACDWGYCRYLEVCCGQETGNGVAPRCATTCPATSPRWCTGSEDCGGNPCCETLSGPSLGQMANQGMQCGTSANSCVPTLVVSSSSAVTRACHTDADCAPSTDLPNCCHFQTGAGVCLNPSIASMLGAMCP